MQACWHALLISKHWPFNGWHKPVVFNYLSYARPGTNFIVRRSIIEAIGGWDDKALAEDTEISFRIYMMGYKISFNQKQWRGSKSHKLCQFGSDNGRDGSKAIFMSLLKMLNYCLILKRVGSVLISYISCPFIFS